jgi:hypothetical protein
MNDDPTTDALERASAYLDGELDAADSAAAEADPVVMAEVARLRSIQEAVRDVAAPSARAREAAIGAALADFDRQRQPVPVTKSRSRPAYSRWLAVAAAVAGVAALGAVIVATARGGDDDHSAAEQTAATSFASGAVADRSTGSAGGGAAAETTAPVTVQAAAPNLESAGTPASSASESAAVLALPAPSETRAAAATTAAPATTAAAAGTGADSTVPEFDSATPIKDELELGSVGRQLLAEWVAGTRERKVGTKCDTSVTDLVLLSDAQLIVDGMPRAVLIAGNPSNDETFALDPETCVVVLAGR